MNNCWKTLLVLVIAGLVSTMSMASTALAESPMNLAGTWRFALDRADISIGERWFNRDLPDRISLPGILQSQGYGDEVSVATPRVLSLYY